MRAPCYRFTSEEDRIILQEVVRSPENILAASCKAAARIFQDESLVSLRGDEALTDPKVRKILNRWYRRLSKSNTCMVLFSKNHLLRNRKIQKRGTTLAIPIVSTPKVLFTSFTRQFNEFKWN